MKAQQEFVSDIFHTLAQPITALRTAVELGLQKDLNGAEAEKILGDCLQLIDRLMQDLSMLREIAELDSLALPPLLHHEALPILNAALEDMLPVAEAGGIQVNCTAEAGSIDCRQALLSRAVFLILDDLIGHLTAGGVITLSLRHVEGGMQLEICPGMVLQPKQKLCDKLLQTAGAQSVAHTSKNLTAEFPSNL